MLDRHLSEISLSGNGIVPMFTVLIFLIFIFSVPTFGQMGSTSTYSDSWATDDGTIFGAGVTSDSSNGYGHTYWTVTTLSSPSGRTASATSYRSYDYSAYTRAETSLAWDWNDL